MSKSKLDIISLVLGKELAGGGGVSVDSLELTSYPDTTTYMVGDELDLKGLAVYAEVGSLSGDVTDDCTFTPANGDTITADTTKVTVKYGNQKVDFPLTVRIPTVITVSSQPTKTDYMVGDTVDLTGVSVTATYSELRGTIDVTDKCTFTPADGDVLDSSSITGIDVSFAGLSATIPITVYDVESIAITKAPNKIVYKKGDTLDLTGIVITGYANNGELSSDVTVDCTFNPDNGYEITQDSGSLTINVSFGSLTTAFNITVSADPLNTYSDMVELIKDYYSVAVKTYVNQSITINGVSLSCDIYRVADDTVLTSSVFTECKAVDANTQIIVGKNLSVASGTTLTPPYRCKGIIIGDVGTFTNAGTISMTARGASGAGKNIQLTASYKISAIGGTGGASTTDGNYSSAPNNGSAPVSGVLSCGGGGSGSSATDGYGNSGYSGAGGSGTSFSGGAGGGGGVSSRGGNGSSTGGAGGAGLATTNRATSATGGAGNPKGTEQIASSATVNTSGTYGTGEGTGGLIIIMANDIVHSGSLDAKGVTARCPIYVGMGYSTCPGGSSGGGCIVLISSTRNITGTNSVAGGASAVGAGWPNYYNQGSKKGGAGGSGAYASYIVENLFS